MRPFCLELAPGSSPVAVKRSSIMLCLIECGQTIWQTDGRVQGASDLPLSQEGRSGVLDQLSPLDASSAAVIHHPEDEAATETARLCAARISAKTKAVAELADPNLGLLEGVTIQEFAERFPSRYKQWEDDPLSLAPPEGEMIIDAADRIFKATARTLKRSRSGEIGIVLHTIGLGLMRSWLANQPLQAFRSMLTDRPRIERYSVSISLLRGLENASASAFSGR